MDATEAAIAENTNHIPALRLALQMPHDGIGIRQIHRDLAASLEILHQPLRVQSLLGFEQFQPRDLRNQDAVRVAKGLGQFLLEHIATGRIAPRLEHGPDALMRMAQTQRAQGFANRRRVVAKVVHHRHAAGDAPDLHSAFDALERVEGRLNLFV
jgi:hypothetical protein